MGSRGPAPKPPAQRRRRNKPPETLKITAPEAPEIPELPFVGTPQPFTLRWWETVWRSPMASRYVDGDVPALIRLAQLVDSVARGQSNAQEMAEIRQLEDRFGLNPMARKRLGWEVIDDEPAEGVEHPPNVTDLKKWQQRLA